MRPVLSQPDGLRPFLWAAILGSITQSLGNRRCADSAAATTAVIINGEFVGARPVSAAAALIMLIGMIVLLPGWAEDRPAPRPTGGVAGGLHHRLAARSVWVAAAVAGVLIVSAIARTSRQRLVVGHSLAVIGAGVVATGVAAVVRSQEQLTVVGQLDRDPRMAHRQLDREAHHSQKSVVAVADRLGVRAYTPE